MMAENHADDNFNIFYFFILISSSALYYKKYCNSSCKLVAF